MWSRLNINGQLYYQAIYHVYVVTYYWLMAGVQVVCFGVEFPREGSEWVVQVGRLGLRVPRARRTLRGGVRGALRLGGKSSFACQVRHRSLSTHEGPRLFCICAISIAISGRGTILGRYGKGVRGMRRGRCRVPSRKARALGTHPIIVNDNPTKLFYTCLLTLRKCHPLILRHNTYMRRHGGSISHF